MTCCSLFVFCVFETLTGSVDSTLYSDIMVIMVN